MTPAQLWALTNGESEINKRAEEQSKKPQGQKVQNITSPEQSNLLRTW